MIAVKNKLERSDVEIAADNLEYFVNYVSSPWRIMWTNFLAGIFRGLGALIGVSIVIGLTIWLLGLFTNVPLLGSYVKDFDQVLSGYLYKTDYNDELDQVSDTLKRIENVLKESNN